MRTLVASPLLAAEPTLEPTALQAPTAPRRIVHRTRGRRHGPVVRLVSPSDLGQLIKPFVFLDAFEADGAHAPKFGIHPHSGIATFTVLLEGSFSYEDTSGKSGVLAPGGVEWMRAGSGVWHDGAAVGGGRMKGYQLWIALPAAWENAPAESQYLAPEELEEDGPVRVLLGRYGSAGSRIATPAPMNYLSVRLADGERWQYQPPEGHTVGWVAVHEGELHTSEVVQTGELAVFDAADGAIDFVAKGATAFVLGSAPKHPHDLVLGSYSVHTTAAALREGEAGIAAIGRRLRSEGRLG
ncbi:MAG: pirin family protein [Myxococcota bacterium]